MEHWKIKLIKHNGLNSMTFKLVCSAHLITSQGDTGRPIGDQRVVDAMAVSQPMVRHYTFILIKEKTGARKANRG